MDRMDSNLIVASGSKENETTEQKLTDAVISAQNLVCPTPKSRHSNECDHKYFDFWRKNDEIIKQAWKDYPFNSIRVLFSSLLTHFNKFIQTVEMGGFLRDLSRMYLAPIMGFLFPDIIGINDVVDQHGFTVRYKHGEDLELKEHRDSSNATMNLCLGRPGFTGSSLYFREGQTSKTKDYSFNVGDAIFHKGNNS